LNADLSGRWIRLDRGLIDRRARTMKPAALMV
jgi:hypothetical protein